MRDEELWEALDRGADGLDEIDFAHSAWERGMGMRRRRQLLTGGGLAAGVAAAALVFGLMGGGQQEALVQPGPAVLPTADVLVTDSPEPSAEEDRSTQSAAPTTEEVAVPEVAAPSEEPSPEPPTTPARPTDEPTEPSAAPTGPVAPVDPPTTGPPTTEPPTTEPPTTDPPTTDPAFPTDPVAYADALVQAWAAGDTARSGELAVDEVALALASYSSEGGWTFVPGMPWEDHPAAPDLAVLEYHHPGGGGSLQLAVEVAALGGPDAVVELDADAGPEQGVRPLADAPLISYAESFLHAWTAGDAQAVERLSSPGLVEQLTTFPTLEETGTVYTIQGFRAYRGEDIGVGVIMPEGSLGVWGWMLDLEPAVAVPGLDHGATRFGFSGDRKWL